MEWIVFSIGTTRHFYIYYLKEDMRSYRVEIESIAAIERLMKRIRCKDAQFVTRYDTERDYIYQKQLDAAVERLRGKYRRQ